MKKVENTSQGTNYTAITVGKLADLSEHILTLGPGMEIPGKVFVGSSLHATGAEMSFQKIEPNAGGEFLHIHRTHEELYIIVKGIGEFQVDGTVFTVSEGSVICVASKGKRALRNTGTQPLVMICVQYKADSFDESDAKDGEILGDSVVW